MYIQIKDTDKCVQGENLAKINISKMKNSYTCGNKLYKCNESNQSSATRNFFRFFGKGTV